MQQSRRRNVVAVVTVWMALTDAVLKQKCGPEVCGWGNWPAFYTIAICPLWLSGPAADT
jgi:hypothetical protein